MARALDIISYNNDLGGLASLDRFTWRDGGELASEIVIREKNVSPYCVGPASRRLIFVDLPPDLDLASAAFAHFDQALARRDGVGNQLALDDAARGLVVDTLAKHPRRHAPDVILPGTVRP